MNNQILHNGTWIFVLFFLTLSFSGPNLSASENEDPCVAETKRLLAEPEGDTKVRIRVTSQFPSGNVTTSYITLIRNQARNIKKYLIQIDGNEQEHQICFQCNSRNEKKSCVDSSYSQKKNEKIPGTLLPWSEVLGSLCNEWSVSRLADRPEGLATVKIVSTRPLAWYYTLAYYGPDSLPVKFERYDKDDTLQYTIQVLEIKRTVWGTGIKRSLLFDPQNKWRIIVEVVSIIFPDKETDI